MNKDLNTIWDILPDARLVGGCVRDKLMGLEPHDYDFCTERLPEEVMDIFSTNGFQVIPTGLQHGTVSVVVNENVYEITTLRTDDETDGRHAKVSFTRSWESDSKRRDFSMNALYMDSEGNIYDYHNGREDIQNRKIKFIGNAEDRIKEDSLRILRYYRFMSKLPTFTGYGKDIEDIIKNKSLIKNLSIERVYSELVKIFNSENKWNVIKQLNEHGISDIIFNKEIIIPKTEIADCSYIDIFSYMADKKDYMKIFKSKVSDIRYVNNVLSLNDTLDECISDHEVRKLLLDYSHDEIISSVIKNTLYKKIDNWEVVSNKIKNTITPVFPIKGQDIVHLGFPSGEIIGEKLKLLKDIWIDSDFKESKDDLLLYLKQ